MFFGLEIKSSQKQAKPITLMNNLRLTQAVLEPSKNGKKEPVCLVLEYEKKQSILCVLDPSLAWQSALDIVLAAGSLLKFSVRGAGTVHLIGYEVQDDYDDVSVTMSDSDDLPLSSDDEDVDEVKTKKVVQSNTAKKPQKGSNKQAEQTNGVKVPSKKRKISPVPAEADDDDDDESDDLDYKDTVGSDSDDDDISLDEASDDEEVDVDDDSVTDDDDDDDDEEMNDEAL